MEVDEGIDYVELLTSLLFTMGAAVGMEFYARIAHKSWWHETWMWALPEEWRGYVFTACICLRTRELGLGGNREEG